MLRFLEKIAEPSVYRWLLQQRLVESFSIKGINTFESISSYQLNNLKGHYLSVEKLNLAGLLRAIKLEPSTVATIQGNVDQEKDFCSLTVVAYMLYNKYRAPFLKFQEENKSSPSSESLFYERQKLRNQIIADNISPFFDDLRSIVEFLIKEYKRSKSASLIHESSLYDELCVNIRRRFYQLVKFSSRKKNEPKSLLQFAMKIEQKFSILTKCITDYVKDPKQFADDNKKIKLIQSLTPTNENIELIIDYLCQKKGQKTSGLMHHLVGDTFRAMVSLEYSKNGFCPFTMMQRKRFLKASGIKDVENLDTASISFIATSVSTIVFRTVSSNASRHFSLSGFKEIGKSINLVVCAIFMNYSGEKVILIPTITSRRQADAYTSIFEALWSQMDEEQMIKLNQLKNNNTEDVKPLFQIVKRQLSNSIVVMDQFSTLIGLYFLGQDNQTQQQKQLYQSALDLYRQLKRNSKKNIMSSSISFEHTVILEIVGEPRQQIDLKQINKLFQGVESQGLLKIWMRRIIHLNPNKLIVQTQLKLIELLIKFVLQKDEKLQEIQIDANMDEIKQLARGLLEAMNINSQESKDNHVFLEQKLKQYKTIEEQGLQENYQQIRQFRKTVKEILYNNSITWYNDMMQSWLGDILNQTVYQKKHDLLQEILIKGQIELTGTNPKPSTLLPRFLCNEDGKMYQHVKSRRFDLFLQFDKTLKMNDKDLIQTILNYCIKVKPLNFNTIIGQWLDLAYQRLMIQEGLENDQGQGERRMKNLLSLYRFLSKDQSISLKAKTGAIRVKLNNQSKNDKSFLKFAKELRKRLQIQLITMTKNEQKDEQFLIFVGTQPTQTSLDGMMIKLKRRQDKKFNCKIILTEVGLNKVPNTGDIRDQFKLYTQSILNVFNSTNLNSNLNYSLSNFDVKGAIITKIYDKKFEDSDSLVTVSFLDIELFRKHIIRCSVCQVQIIVNREIMTKSYRKNLSQQSEYLKVSAPEEYQKLEEEITKALARKVQE